MRSEPEPIADAATTRREFCTRACQAASLAALGLFGSHCGGGPTSPGSDLGSQLTVVTASRLNGVVTLTIDAGSPLANAGGAALVQSPTGNFLVARTGQTTFVALTAMCTHQACVVTNFSGSLYVCPCHGSEYDQSGRVVRGPALQSLRQFATQFSDPTLTISA